MQVRRINRREAGLMQICQKISLTWGDFGIWPGKKTIRKKCVLSCGATAAFDTQDPEIRLEVRTEDDILMRNRYQMTKLQTGISAVR